MPNFVSVAASIAELAHGEKSHTHSITYSHSLFDAPGTEALALRNISSTLLTKMQMERTMDTSPRDSSPPSRTLRLLDSLPTVTV